MVSAPQQSRAVNCAHFLLCKLALIATVACHQARPVAPGPLPRAAYAHYVAGKLALYRDDPDAAAAELALAAAAAPEQPMIAVEEARALVKAKRPDEARALLAATRTNWPDHAQVWLASGELLEKSAPIDAARAYLRTIDLDGSTEHAYLGLARLELAANNATAAERTLRSLVARVPGSTEGHYRLAQRLVTRGDLAAAAKELRATLEHDPDHVDARIDLARVLRRQGRLGEAIVQARSAFDRAAQPLDLAEELFWLLCEADDRQAAIDLLTLLDDDRSDADGLATVARLDRGLGRLVEAREIATRITALDPTAGAIALAEIDLAAGDTKAAADGALEAGAIDLATQALLAAGEPQRALDVLGPARAAKPDDVNLALAEAYARADLGDPAAARVVLTAVHGDPVAVAVAQARLADHLHDPAGALAALEPILPAHPDDVAALDLAGYVLADTNQRLDVAERYLRHARELAPGDPAILDSWGWLLLRRGDPRGAILALTQASRFAPREPEILLHLATAWAAYRAPGTAAELLDRAAALHPTPDVQHRIDALRPTLVYDVKT